MSKSPKMNRGMSWTVLCIAIVSLSLFSFSPPVADEELSSLAGGQARLSGAAQGDEE